MNQALQTFFEAARLPAVIVDADDRVVLANAAFAREVGAREATALAGAHISDVLQGELEADHPLLLTAAGGHTWVAAVTDADTYRLITLEGTDGDPLGSWSAELLANQSRLFSLGRLFSLLRDEDDLISAALEGLRDLFPDRNLCIRLFGAPGLSLSAMHADGPLKPGAAERIELRESAIRETLLPQEVLDLPNVSVTEGYVNLFTDAEVGFGVPLVAGRTLLGTMHVEGRADAFDDLENEERLLISLANQLSVAVRNARLLAEAELLRDSMQQVIDNANALILAVDAEGGLTLFNRACEAFSGYSAAEVLGAPVADLVPTRSRGRLARLISIGLRGRPAENVLIPVKRRAGDDAEIVFNSAPVRDRHGQVKSVVVVGSDITRLRELERRLMHSEKLATLGRFAASVVHELNNPLTSIQVYAEALRDRLEESGQSGPALRAERILENAQRVLVFAQDLISYSQPVGDTGAKIDIRDVVEESIRHCEHVAAETETRVVAVWTEDVPLIRGHRDRLEQVFVNLITNACHAAPGGRVELGARVDDTWVTVDVRDDGEGIPEDSLESIFEPFFTTKAPGKGTGLGLPIVTGIVQGHSGELTVESTPGSGTVFHVSLPRVDVD